MIRRLALVASVAALGFSTIGVEAAHAAAPIAGTGTVGTCTLTAKAKIKPGLVFGGVLTPVTTKFSGKLSGCAGGTGDGANVTGGTVKGTITSASPNDCLGLAVTGLAAFDVTIKWKTAPATPKLLPTTTHIAPTPAANIVIGTWITITLTGTNDPAPTGSFASNAVTATANTDETAATFAAACATPKGLKAFTFSGLNAPSTITG